MLVIYNYIRLEKGKFMNKKDKTLKESLTTSNDLDLYLRDRGKRHKYYRNYGQFPRLTNNLYKEQAIFLSDGTGWNDSYDVEKFRNKNGKIKLYGLCFSYSIDESVAMWMLYGGRKDNGGMYYFTQTQLLKIIDSHPNIELGYFNKKGSFCKKLDIQRANYNIYIKDVLYSSQINNNLYRIYRDSESATTNKRILKGAESVLKHSGWSYEKETRLIIEVPLNNDDIIMSCTHAKISLVDALGTNWIKGFEKQIYYSPKCSSSRKIRAVYHNKQIGFSNSVLTGMIDWNIK